jgi:hypothetical protein
MTSNNNATFVVDSYQEAAVRAKNDAAIADKSTETRVLALAANMRSSGSIPIPAKGLIISYIRAFLESRGIELASPWTNRPDEFLAITAPDGRGWIRRYSEDAGADVWSALWNGEDVSQWHVEFHP